eukprot:gene4782-6707_t
MNWNFEWAKLSVKWQIQEYIEAYALIAQKQTLKIINKTSVLKKSCYYTCSGRFDKQFPCTCNLINEINGPRCRYNKDLYRCPNWCMDILLNKNGETVKHLNPPSTCQKCLNTLIRITPDTLEDKLNKKNLHHIVSPITSLFWELVIFLFDHAPKKYCVKPFATRKNLASTLSNCKQLWNKKQMLLVFSAEDFADILDTV